MVAELLIIEDNPAHADLLCELLEEADVPFSMQVIHDGQKALEALQGAATLPRLIILDLNLPRLSGLSVLRTVRSQTALKHIPIVVMSVSNEQEEIRRCYASGAAAYIVKPIRLVEYEKVVDSIVAFWGRAVALS